jgi:flavin reductase (DIM6/NTAB) family NADH-FMN oxidoreductase RutF
MLDDAPALDPRALRRAFGSFPTGVTICATLDAAGAPVGFTANSFTSVSLDPPLLLVCLARTASSFAAFETARAFGVSVLGAAQREASTVFATRGADKFAAVAWSARATGAPLIDGAVAWFDCRAERLEPAGDHVILLGRVVAFGATEDAPLGYCRGAYVSFGLDSGAFDAARGGLRAAALVERAGSVLLDLRGRRPALPSAAAYGPAGRADSLLGGLARAGAAVELPFLVAAYDEGEVHTVVYRGAVPADAPAPAAGFGFAPLDDLPLSAMTDGETLVLRRYVAERAAAPAVLGAGLRA